MALGSKRNAKGHVKQFFGVRIIVIIILLIIIHPFTRSQDKVKNYYIATNNEVVLAVGFIIFLSGLALALWARLYLGKNWGMPMTLKQEPELVTNGPYKYIRHPIYAGILLAAFGSALASSAYWLLFIVFAGSYFIYSARIEEKNMLKEFPKVYSSYKSSTKMLIPFIY
jgi:protein-S-isoprenylcysteine O-methyltransferase Ste14